jgi:hypothetical protein
MGGKGGERAEGSLGEVVAGGGGMQEPVLVPVLGLQVALETRCFLPHPAEGL